MKMRKNGFTIVEVFIVLSIIAVLASLLAGAAIRSRQKAKNVTTYVTLDALAAALEMYKEDFGDYPPDNTWGADGAGSLYYYLGATFRIGRNADINAGPYLKYVEGKNINSSSIGSRDFNGDGIADSVYSVIDGWGNTIHYDSTNPTHNENSYDMYSDGADSNNNSGGLDDINNWE